MKTAKQITADKTSLTFNEFCRGITGPLAGRLAGPLDSVGAGVHLKITENNRTIATIYNSSANPDSWSFPKYQERILVKDIRNIYNKFKGAGEDLDVLIVRTDVKKPNLVLSFRHDNKLS